MGGGGGIDAAITRPPLMKMLPPTFHQIKLNAGGLGPGTLVGSAAFDLFPIHVVCVVVPKAGELKKISDLGVWIVELFWSFWAYIWLYIILEVLVTCVFLSGSVFII